MKSLDELWSEVLTAQGVDVADVSKPQESMTDANGLRFRVLDWGGDGEPILFLHGAGQDAGAWELLCILLRARGYRCLAIDLRNHGKSSRAPIEGRPFDPRDAASDLGPVLTALRLRRPAIVAHSMGGLAALYWLVNHPEDCRALVCVDITPTPARTSLAKTLAYRAKREWPTWEAALHDAAEANPCRPLVQLELGLRRSLTRREDGAWVRRSRAAPAMARPRTPAEERALVDPATPPYADLIPALGRLRLPVLVAFGGRSEVTSAEHVDRFVRGLPDARSVCIPDATHAVHGDKPKPLADAIASFLAAVHPVSVHGA